MTTFGAVPVGGRNFFRLLQNGEAVLLFPGGVREVRPASPHALLVVKEPWCLLLRYIQWKC